ncbi:MAG: NYN domain-containing protein [Pirellulaceae bacterium]|nr:NYN domain-containing protein [Pirellulaceae bacterium]HJN09188.1 NYN domain-containing protein [Pirellulaceae bacterium]
MAILIDGYNLLHAAGIIPRGIGTGTLQHARSALLNWLVAALEPDQVAETTVVFDAANPPAGLPRRVDHQGLTVLFSTDHENADAMLEDLIRQAAVPKRLVVVSSDHRVQRAARRRRSIAVDSDVWYFDLRHQGKTSAIEPQEETKPPAPLSAMEVQHWLDEFGDFIDDLDRLDTALPEHRSQNRVPKDELPDHQSGSGADAKFVERSLLDDSDASEGDDTDLANPFPPGYGEDLLRPDANLD